MPRRGGGNGDGGETRETVGGAMHCLRACGRGGGFAAGSEQAAALSSRASCATLSAITCVAAH